MEYIEYVKSKRGIYAIILFCIIIAQLVLSLLGVVPNTRNKEEFAWAKSNTDCSPITIWRWLDEGMNSMSPDYKSMRLAWILVFACLAFTVFSAVSIAFGWWLSYIFCITLTMMIWASSLSVLGTHYFHKDLDFTPIMYSWLGVGAIIFVTWIASMISFQTEMSSRKPTTIRPVEQL